MKKLILLTLCLSFTALVPAQEITWGAKAGVNFATITGDETDGVDSRTGFHAGAVANIGIN